jgi:hypothetical protein
VLFEVVAFEYDISQGGICLKCRKSVFWAHFCRAAEVAGKLKRVRLDAEEAEREVRVKACRRSSWRSRSRRNKRISGRGV